MEEKTPASPISRRELLKLLTAGGGAAAASAFLPAKWVKPLVQAGVLPAHAQSSRAPEPPPAYLIIGNLTATFSGSLGAPNRAQTNNLPSGIYYVSFQYSDSHGSVSSSSQVYVNVDTVGQIANGGTVGSYGGSISGNGYAGIIGNLAIPGSYPSINNPTCYTNLVSGGRTSNTVNTIVVLNLTNR